ncbi:MAG: DUF362 domain-containing protein [Chloroflexota bacterium]|nr:MAG: DUF362 domain-containing protein [Chloroflexota bacterium]
MGVARVVLEKNGCANKRRARGVRNVAARRRQLGRESIHDSDCADECEMKSISRRSLLRLALGGGILAGGAVIYKQTESVGLDKWMRWMLRGQTARLNPPARVALASVASYDDDVLSAIRTLWRDANAPDLANARVVLKPNLVDSIPERPCYTMPQVTEALIQFLRDEIQVKALVVAEGMTFRRDPHAILIETGYREMLERQRVEFVDLNYDDLVKIPLRGGYAKMDSLFMARTVAEADALISIPKLKTHHWTKISGSIKNLFGIVPGAKYGFPKNTLHMHGIDAFLAELLDSLPTPKRFALVDGIVGLQGDGPLFGAPVPSGALIGGQDFLAVDATAARLMGFDPTTIEILAFMAWAGLGQIDVNRIQVRGAALNELKRNYELAPTL